MNLSEWKMEVHIVFKKVKDDVQQVLNPYLIYDLVYFESLCLRFTLVKHQPHGIWITIPN